jgi:hypothetical protein
VTARGLLLSRRAWVIALLVLLPIGVVLGALIQQTDTGASACVSHWNDPSSPPERTYAHTGGTYRALISATASSCSVWVRTGAGTTAWDAVATGGDIGEGSPLGEWARSTAPPPPSTPWNAEVSGTTGRLSDG